MEANTPTIADAFTNAYLDAQEEALVASSFKKVILTKGDILLKGGTTVVDQYFISTGCLRTYYEDSYGKEYTLQFAIKDWWISDYTAFFSASMGILSIECIENAVVYKISHSDMEILYDKIPKLEHFFRKKLEKAFASFQKRILGNLSKPAKERYLTFIHSYPTIEKKVKNYHIASYLGITTESLSRIRKEIAKE